MRRNNSQNAGCVEQALYSLRATADDCEDGTTAKLLMAIASTLESGLAAAVAERDNAERREYEVLGRANALEGELRATQARLDTSDELLREEFAIRQDLLATLRDSD